MENRRLFLIGMTLLAFAVAPVANASLKDKKAQSDALDNIKGNIASASEACGGKVSVDVDWKSFASAYTDSYHEANAANYCGDVVDGVRQLCQAGDAEKKSVQKGVKKVVCKFKSGMTTDEFGKSGIKLSGGTLEANYAWDTANVADKVKEYLSGKLD